MRITKFLFPIILLIIFFGVIALGVAAGFWETKGGRGPGQHESAVPVSALVPTWDIPEKGQATWQL